MKFQNKKDTFKVTHDAIVFARHIFDLLFEVLNFAIVCPGYQFIFIVDFFLLILY